jgi:hypothetical protein
MDVVISCIYTACKVGDVGRYLELNISYVPLTHMSFSCQEPCRRGSQDHQRLKEVYTTLLFPLLRTSDVLALASSNDDTGSTALLTSRLAFDGYTVLQYSLASLCGCNSVFGPTFLLVQCLIGTLLYPALVRYQWMKCTSVFEAFQHRFLLFIARFGSSRLPNYIHNHLIAVIIC